ncbi:MAG TPA: hypothetical protein PK074_07935 [Spirochaetales bacterium]|nr:hypothetical protein [Spirochaetales bacterium]HRV29634.1 hypothetical protein [Spirochaetia bacterium]
MTRCMHSIFYILGVISIVACNVSQAKNVAVSKEDTFPLTIQQKAKKPPEDIQTQNFPEPPGSLNFEDRHLVAKPLTEVRAYDFYLGNTKQPAWVQPIIAAITNMLSQKKIDDTLLSEIFPKGLKTTIETTLQKLDGIEEIRFASVPLTKPQFLVLDFVIFTKEKRLQGECIADSESGKLIHIMLAPLSSASPRAQNKEVNPLELLQELQK